MGYGVVRVVRPFLVLSLAASMTACGLLRSSGDDALRIFGTSADELGDVTGVAVSRLRTLAPSVTEKVSRARESVEALAVRVERSTGDIVEAVCNDGVQVALDERRAPTATEVLDAIESAGIERAEGTTAAATIAGEAVDAQLATGWDAVAAFLGAFCDVRDLGTQL